MLRVSLMCILVMVVLLSASLLCQAATISGLASSYSVDENFDGTITSFSVDPVDTAVTFSGNGLASTEQSTLGTYDITFTTPPNYEVEAQRSYSFTVTVEDGSASGTVTVLDVDEAPTITGGPTTHSVPEADTTGTVSIGTYAANDPESVDITWLIEGAESSFFSITALGVLSFNPPSTLNYETKSSYSVTVVASDGTLRATRSVTVTISNVEEPGTVTLAPPQRTEGWRHGSGKPHRPR